MSTTQLSLFAEPDTPYTITELTRHIKTLVELDPTLQDVQVQGEISNFTRASSGHLYFSLKDAKAQLKCVMWKSEAARLRFDPKHGDQVIVHGKVSVYDAQGTYQLYAKSLQPIGAGDLHQQFELLKAKLEAEGLFDSDRKRSLPPLPRLIGIVSSPTAAGFKDVLNILERRYPSVQVILSAAQVQGKAAPPTIIKALKRLAEYSDLDLILVVRGGGSLEDLWCFNDEAVARAIAESPIPIMTGVGHEIDFTLADFAADVRAPTPSAAAELSVPDRRDVLGMLAGAQHRMITQLENRLQDARNQLTNNQRTLKLVSPANRIQQHRQQADDAAQRLQAATLNRGKDSRQRLALLASRLDSASPQAILKRGYVLATDTTGKRITSANDAKPDDTLRLQFTDGSASVTVNKSTTDE